MSKLSSAQKRKILGWREWVSLPDLNVKKIKAKLDTGARTSALHASNIEIYSRAGKDYVEFDVHPIQRSATPVIRSRARVEDYRVIRSSSGEESERPVISTRLRLGDYSHEIEMTLVNRDLMGFRFLLGRQALRGLFLVDPGTSYFLGRPEAKAKKKKKRKR